MRLQKGRILVLILFFFIYPTGVLGDLPLTKDVHSQLYPAIYKDYVVWMDLRNGNWDIYGYNLYKGLEFPLLKIRKLPQSAIL